MLGIGFLVHEGGAGTVSVEEKGWFAVCWREGCEKAARFQISWGKERGLVVREQEGESQFV